MASQQTRPPWFRLRSMAPVAAPPAAPSRPPVMRPLIPTRPPSPPPQQPPPPPTPNAPQPRSATPLRESPVSAPPRSATPPRESLVSAPPRSATPPRSPISPVAPASPPAAPPSATPPIPSLKPASSPPRSPLPMPASLKSPIATPPPSSPVAPIAPPRSPLPMPASLKSPIATPPPSSPVPPPPASPPSPLPKTTYSVPTSPKTTLTAKATTPPSSPKIVIPLETSPPPQSLKITPLPRSPSPLTLPPPQLNPYNDRDPMIQQKDVLVQETIDKTIKLPKAHNGKREPTSKYNGTTNKVSNPQESGMRMITIAGDNKGAVMELGPSHKKNYSIGKPHTLQKQSNGHEATSDSAEEGKANNMTTTPTTAFLNSNVQGLNNSILHNCTFQNNSPGIHLSLNRKANGGGPTKE